MTRLDPEPQPASSLAQENATNDGYTMTIQSIRRRLAISPIARGAALPLRARAVARYDTRVIGRSLDWLVRGRETTNYTYDLDSLNRDQLCWFVSAVTGAGIAQVRFWVQELEGDDQLFDALTRRLSTNPRWRKWWGGG